MALDLMAINESLLEHSLEGLGETIELLSPSGIRYSIKAQVIRVHNNTGEDSRGIAQGSRQTLKLISARASVRISTILAFEPSGDLTGWGCKVRIYPREDSAYQQMFVEQEPGGDISLGIRILPLVAVRRVTP